MSPVERTFVKSAELLERSRRSLAGGVSSPFRAKAPIPLFISDARGSRLTDVDGNEFIDYSLAWGPLILGHRHPKLVATLREQAERPHVYGAQHELEFELAELVQAVVPCAERLAFTSSGSEAVQIALRLARAATGRSLILKFEGHYHGWMDSVLLSYKPRREELETSRFGANSGNRGRCTTRLTTAGHSMERRRSLRTDFPTKITALRWQRSSQSRCYVTAGVSSQP